ncbi:YfjD family protein [Bacillus haynesii]|uniref:YfjD family protein n=1 Tax=Bacillus haynesii TaxID=1925021 RepID=UPI002282D62A|nr:YfjD family protein [Bacillus haynesii]MCY9261815.1 YfjD family protein [Bacillus haynesii]MCY9370114.1 YfjD family protein [Bacillus haynesii]MEC1532638.1 YfjD family protein [Bacillus haynesii]
MEQGKKQPIDVKSRMFFRVWVFAGTAGFGLVGAWLFYEAIKLELKYSLLYLGIGLFGIIYGLITFLMVFPAFTKKGNIIFRMIEGEDGRLFSGKKSVLFKDIKSLKMEQHRCSPKGIFFMDIMIETFGNGMVRIPTYNILPEPAFYKAVELYILPYMTEEARADWIGRFTEAQRKAYLNEFHKDI